MRGWEETGSRGNDTKEEEMKGKEWRVEKSKGEEKGGKEKQ